MGAHEENKTKNILKMDYDGFCKMLSSIKPAKDNIC